MPKISVTLTEIPCAVAAVIAGSPSLVAGILISALRRSTARHSSWADAIVASVSWARSGSTSIETRPSAGFVSCTGARTSQASRTSSVVSSKMTRSVVAPSATSLRTCSS